MRLALLVLLALPAAAQEPKVVTTASGLGFELLEEGTKGTAPAPGDYVKVHYTGWLADGKKFDSSRDRGEPLAFVLGVGMVIPAWDEGIAKLDTGAKARLHVPPELGYGDKGYGQLIPPKSDLLFEVELVGVSKGVPFRAADPERQETTGSGLKWEVIEEGSGDPPGPDDLVRLRCTVWTAEGRIAFSSASLPVPIVGTASGVALTGVQERFLPEAVGLMKPGGKCRFEVPPGLCWGKTRVVPNVGEDETTVWQVELVRTLRLAPLHPERTKRTASGLEYEVLEEGSGKSPRPGGAVMVHYIGWLEDGTEFDSSFRRGEPAQFELENLIKGWTEGLKLMKERACYRFRIPPALAYGEKGAPAMKIPPNATLVFEVDLLRVR